MKKIFALAVVLSVVGLAACTKCSPGSVKDMVSGGDKPMAVEEIGKILAPIICAKYGTCNQNPEFNKDQCIKEISTGIGENLKNAADLKVTSSVLEACQKAIGAAPCEALNSTNPPTGCEFLQ